MRNSSSLDKFYLATIFHCTAKDSPKVPLPAPSECGKSKFDTKRDLEDSQDLEVYIELELKINSKRNRKSCLQFSPKTV